MSDSFDEVIKHLPGQHTQQSHGRKGSGGGGGGSVTEIEDKLVNIRMAYNSGKMGSNEWLRKDTALRKQLGKAKKAEQNQGRISLEEAKPAKSTTGTPGGGNYSEGTQISFYRKGGRQQGSVIGKRADGRLDVRTADGKKRIVDPNRKRSKVKVEGEGVHGKKKPSIQQTGPSARATAEAKANMEAVHARDRKRAATSSKKVTAESIANETGNFTPKERKFMVRQLIGSKQAKSEYDQEYSSRWSKRGGHAGSKQISQKLEKAEAMGFKQVDLRQGHSPDGSYIGSGEYYEHPRGATIVTSRNYGVVASENSFNFSLDWKQDSEGGSNED